MKPQPKYDAVRDTWRPQCPHGDECSACDELGYCEKGRIAAAAEAIEAEQLADEEAAQLENFG